jgi:hypothetical protein
VSTEPRRLLAWTESSSAEELTWRAAVPVWSAALVIWAIFAETSRVPCAACCTLFEISRVEAPCSSTAVAIEEEISLISEMTSLISPMALTASFVAD